MFPIRDHNPSLKTPYVTYVLILVNALVFLSYWSLFSDADAINSFFSEWAMIPATITAGENSHSLVTSMFLHGGLFHLAGNMLFLWIFGDNLEDELGHIGFLVFYIACGVAAALAHLLADPSSTIPTVGASGAIAGVMGGYVLLFPKARVDVLFIFIIIFRVFTVPAWVVLGIWFAAQVFSGVTSPIVGGGIAYWAHAGGFLAGVLGVAPIWLRKGGRAYWQATAGAPPRPETKYRYIRTDVPKVRKR